MPAGPAASEPRQPLIVGISGASGAILGIRLLEALHAHPQVERHLVITADAERTILHETAYTVAQVRSLADRAHANNNMSASIASGSFQTLGMIVAPCSMKTLSAIAHGYSDSLLVRAADVCLKEKRRVVLLPRETPLGLAHIENMHRAAQYGCVILPPVLTFYNRPATIEAMIDHLVGKALMQFGLPHSGFKPWQEET